HGASPRADLTVDRGGASQPPPPGSTAATRLCRGTSGGGYTRPRPGVTLEGVLGPRASTEASEMEPAMILRAAVAAVALIVTTPPSAVWERSPGRPAPSPTSVRPRPRAPRRAGPGRPRFI